MRLSFVGTSGNWRSLLRACRRIVPEPRGRSRRPTALSVPSSPRCHALTNAGSNEHSDPAALDSSDTDLSSASCRGLREVPRPVRDAVVSGAGRWRRRPGCTTTWSQENACTSDCLDRRQPLEWWTCVRDFQWSRAGQNRGPSRASGTTIFERRRREAGRRDVMNRPRRFLVEALGVLARRRPVFHSEADFQFELAWELR